MLSDHTHTGGGLGVGTVMLVGESSISNMYHVFLLSFIYMSNSEEKSALVETASELPYCTISHVCN